MCSPRGWVFLCSHREVSGRPLTLISALSPCPAGCEAPGWDLEKKQSLVTLRSVFFLSIDETAHAFLLYSGEVRLLPEAFITIQHGPQLLHWRQMLAGGAQDNSVKRSKVLFGSCTQRAAMGKCIFTIRLLMGGLPQGSVFFLPHPILMCSLWRPHQLTPPGCW